jgi:hypothetical protein
LIEFPNKKMFDPGVAYNPAQWTGFFSAEVSASGALTGLLFVAVSINLPRILAISLLPARAAKALTTLVAILIAASFCLVPGQSKLFLGLELIFVGTVAWFMVAIWERASSRGNTYVRSLQKVLLALIAHSSVVPMIICGISLAIGYGGGLYWLVAGVIISFIAALLDAWVLLIEIQR